MDDVHKTMSFLLTSMGDVGSLKMYLSGLPVSYFAEPHEYHMQFHHEMDTWSGTDTTASGHEHLCKHDGGSGMPSGFTSDEVCMILLTLKKAHWIGREQFQTIVGHF